MSRKSTRIFKMWRTTVLFYEASLALLFSPIGSSGKCPFRALLSWWRATICSWTLACRTPVMMITTMTMMVGRRMVSKTGIQHRRNRTKKRKRKIKEERGEELSVGCYTQAAYWHRQKNKHVISLSDGRSSNNKREMRVLTCVLAASLASAFFFLRSSFCAALFSAFSAALAAFCSFLSALRCSVGNKANTKRKKRNVRKVRWLYCSKFIHTFMLVRKRIPNALTAVLSILLAS